MIFILWLGVERALALELVNRYGSLEPMVFFTLLFCLIEKISNSVCLTKFECQSKIFFLSLHFFFSFIKEVKKVKNYPIPDT